MPAIEMNAVWVPTDGSIPGSALADGAVTAPKIAESAISLTSPSVVGQLPSEKIADSAVTSPKIADGAVDPSKASRAVRQVPLMIVNNEVATIGTTEEEKKYGTFSKNANTNYGAFVVNASIKVDNPAATGSLRVYIDDEAEPRATLTTQTTGYDLKASGEIDISALANGNHTLRAKLVTDTAGATVTNKVFEAHFIKVA